MREARQALRRSFAEHMEDRERGRRAALALFVLCAFVMDDHLNGVLEHERNELRVGYVGALSILGVSGFIIAALITYL